MYLCRLFPAQTLGVKADALNPLEASAFVPPRQKEAGNSKYSAVRPERDDRRHAGHVPRSSPKLVLVAVTLCSGSQAIPRQPPASPGRQHTVPSASPTADPRAPARSSRRSPAEGGVGCPQGLTLLLEATAGRARRRGAPEEQEGCVEPSRVRLGGSVLRAQRCAGPGAAAPSPAGTAGTGLGERCSLSQPANVTGKHG